MKPSLTFLIVFTCLGGYSQKIAGLGPFKIGVTTTAIIDSLKSTGYQLTVTGEKFIDDQANAGKVIFERVTDPAAAYNVLSPTAEGHRVFNIGAMDLENVKVEQIELNFYQDTLYSILVESNDSLMTALKKSIQTIKSYQSQKCLPATQLA